MIDKERKRQLSSEKNSMVLFMIQAGLFFRVLPLLLYAVSLRCQDWG